MTDPHPTSMERGKDMLMTLKKDLKRSDISPKMRKQLSAEVAIIRLSIRVLSFN